MKEENNPKKSFKFLCSQCPETFTKKYNLTRHIRRLHSNVNSNKRVKTLKTEIKCLLCSISMPKTDMCRHYTSVHNIDIITEHLEFSSFTDFEKWKEKTEKDTTSKYIRYRCNNYAKKTFLFYRCHRDGFYNPSGKNIRHLKKIGSNKINGLCPSNMVVTIMKEDNDSTVKVKYTKTHVGHEMDLGHIVLSKTEREELAAKIKQKVSFDEILNEMRDNGSADKLERIHLLKRKDLYNIEHSYKLQSDSVRRSDNCKIRKLSPELSILRSRHKTAMEMNNDIYIMDGYWNVMSSTGTELYEITRNITNCSCDLQCTECDCCIHAFICSCPDNAVKQNMCKHIHYICLYLKTQDVQTDEVMEHKDAEDSGNLIMLRNPESSPEEEEEQQILKNISQASTLKTSEEAETLRASLLKKFNLILNDVEDMDTYRIVEKALLPIKTKLVALKQKN